MTRILMGWEFGGGIGHIGRLAPLARGLKDRGHLPVLALRDLVQTAPHCQGLPALQAPLWLHKSKGVPTPAVSMAEILMANGYLDIQALDALVRGWMGLFAVTRAQAVVVDYAPTALLAARIAGLPAANVASGFVLPPDRQPMPPFRDWEPLPPGRVERSEAQVLQRVNRVLDHHRAAPLTRLSQLLHADLALVCTWPEMDPYADRQASAAVAGGTADAGPAVEWLGPNFSDQAGITPPWPDGDGPRVFAYLKAGHADHRHVLQALEAQGCRVICYMAEIASGMPEPVASPRIRYARAAVDLPAVLRDASLLVGHGGQGTVAQALLHGVPMLLLPMQSEQFLTARAVAERCGAALYITGPSPSTNLAALLQQLLLEPQWRAAAAQVAQRLRGFDHTRQVSVLSDRIEALIDDRIKSAR